MTPAEWRERIGLRIKQRRQDLRLSIRGAAKIAGFSEGLWRELERGERVLAKGVTVTTNPRPSTIAGVADALLWPRDWLDRLRAGEDFDPIEPVEALAFEAGQAIGVVDGRLTVLELTVSEMRDELRQLAEALRRLTREVLDDDGEPLHAATPVDRASE